MKKRIISLLLAVVLVLGLIPAALAADPAPAADPAQSTVSDTGSGSDSTPADDGDSTPANGGDSTPADDGDSTPADDGDSTPADDGDSTPADGDDSTPANDGDSTPANDGDSTPANDGDDDTADAAGTVDVTLSGLHSAQVASLKLYTYTASAKGDTDLLANATAANGQYTVKLTPGDYWVDGYDENNNCNGGVAITVSEASASFKFQRIYQISVNPSGWVRGTDYTLSLNVTDASSAERKAEFGTAVNWGKTDISCLFVVGDTVTVTATPDTTKHPDFNPASASETPTMNDSLSLTCPQYFVITVNAPAGSVISAGIFNAYTIYTFADAVSTQTAGETTTSVFHLSALEKDSYQNTHVHFVRVQHPQGVTYWSFYTWTDSQTLTVTADDLHIGDSSFTKNTVFPNFEKNIYDVGNIYLNINHTGYLNLAPGASKTLQVVRNWQGIESYINAKIALPDVHYTVLDAENPSQSSNVVTIVPDEKNSGVATMTANETGTAIVLVTYDAMTHSEAQSSTKFKGLSAIWPELTGVFVVSVGADGSGIQTNMTLDRLSTAATPLDAEHDFLYYTGDEGASYTFTPESGCTVTVARSTVAASMTFSGFTSSGVTTDAETGAVTVTGLTTGRHIIKLTKGGVSTYQVVSARKVSYTLQNEDGTSLSADGVQPGGKVKVQFSGLLNPKEKLSGIYNSAPYLYLKGEDDTAFFVAPAGYAGVYDFSSSAAQQSIVVTIPKYWSSASYMLSGMICAPQKFGKPTGAHRGMCYGSGLALGSYDTTKIGDNLCSLPSITIPVAKADFITGKLNFVNGRGLTVDRKDLTVSLKDGDGNTVVVQGDGTFQATAGTFYYTINATGYAYASGSIELSTASKSFTVKLEGTSATAWDGMSLTEPKMEDGVYLISTGAELAWLAKNKTSVAFSAKLTADIDLGGYAWTAFGSMSYAQILDGDGHAIVGLNATKGLLKEVGSNSEVKNLTVAGVLNVTADSAGAITGYLSGGKITNCTSRVAITVQSGKKYVGGIAGYTYGTAVISSCVNSGTISGEGTQAGGIVGAMLRNSFNNACGTVTGCINTAAVSGKQDVGGLAGIDKGGKIENSYNTAAVTATQGAGGLIGSANGTKLTSCYNAGSVTGGKAVAGSASNATFTKCYYLVTCGADPNAQALNEQQLKSADLGNAFTPVCGGGYPALTSEGKTAHTLTKTGTTAPTCANKGYTSYTCSVCGKTVMQDYVAALGHDFCTDDGTAGCANCVRTDPTCTEAGKIVRTCRRAGCNTTQTDVIPATGHTPKPGTEQKHPAYSIWECSVCGKTYTAWNDPRLEHLTLTASTLEKITMADTGSYPWVWNEEAGRFTSSNQGKANSSSTTTVSFTLTGAAALSFDYTVSSESGCDKLTITLAGGDTKTLVNGASGTKSGHIAEELAAGSYTLTFSYTKDPGYDAAPDQGTFSNLTLAPKSAPVDPDEPVANTVRVIIENTKLSEADGAPWTGTLVDTTVDITADTSTMMQCVAKALADGGYESVGTDSTYISSINGLGVTTPDSGWMATLNDWFVNHGLDEMTVEAGDEIRVMYTLALGKDLGGSWDSTDTSLASLTSNTGTLSPAFASATHDYTLTVYSDTTRVLLTPTASNKNFQVRMSVDGAVYKRGRSIPVVNGTVITIEVNPEGAPTMNLGADTTTYTVTVAKSGEAAPAKTASVSFTAQAANAFLLAPQTGVQVSGNLAESYGYTDGCKPSEAVTALDVLVKAHELIFGDDFTSDTCTGLLALNDSGFVTTIFGEETSASGFTMNGACPHDGVLVSDPTNGDYYTGYTFAQAAVQTGDSLEFYLYQDDEYYLDLYPHIEQSGSAVSSLTATAGADVTLTLKGYCIAFYGFSPAETILAQTQPIEDAQLALVNAQTGALTNISGAVTGEDGSVTFTAPAAGDYLLTAYVPEEAQTEDYATPVILRLTALHVDAAVTPAPAYESVLPDLLAYVKRSTPNPTVSSTNGEWAVLALARALEGDITVPDSWYDTYCSNAEAYVRAHIAADGKIGTFVTDNVRVVLALTAIGKDPTSFAGQNLLKPFGDLDTVTYQGVNGAFWTLIALDSKAYAVPSGNVTREKLIETILDAQHSDNGWGLTAASDVDMTAMAIQSLAPYYATNNTVKAAVNDALTYLASKQLSAGGYATSETCAQVVVALSALGIDADTDPRFVKNGVSVLGSLLSYYITGSGMKHEAADETADQMASEQGAYALVAYDRFKSDENRLYDMSDVTVTPDEPSSVQDVIDLIGRIGTVDENSYEDITAARKAYDALTPAEQAQVTNYKDLTDAEADYQRILKQKRTDASTALRAHYDKLLSDTSKTYGEAAKKKLLSILQTAQSAIASAVSCERVTEIYDKAIADLDAVKPGDITVTFRLIGALEATQSVDLTSNSYLPDYVTWIPTKSYELAENATVYDLFTKALSDAGLRSVGADNNYVSTIYAPSCLGGYALSEFTNGARSGWMYTVNGSHPSRGLKAVTLKDGDIVIWHYVNDYAHEVADWNGGGQYPSLGNGTYYNGWLRAADISPEQYVQQLLAKILTVGAHGTATPKLTMSHIGKSVTFTFKPDAGYRVKEVKLDGRSLGAVTTCTVTNLTLSTRIEVTFTSGTLPFTDVRESDWFYADVSFAYENGLFSGTSDTTFSPNASMTRAMLVTVLYRLEGQPAVSGRSGFSDVQYNGYYEDAVTWAADNGIVNGTSATTFSPNANVTREQMAAILYRYAQYKKYNTAASSSLTGFSDHAAVSSYAVTPLSWAVAEKLVNGSNGKLMPTGNATRAQVAAILHRFVENVATTK